MMGPSRLYSGTRMTGCAGAGTSLRGNLKGTGTLIMMSRHLRDPADFSVSLFLIIFDDFFMRRIIDDKILNYDLGFGILRCWNRNWETTQLLPVMKILMMIDNAHCSLILLWWVETRKTTQLPPVMPHLRFSIVAERFQIFGKPCRTFSGVISTPRFSP